MRHVAPLYEGVDLARQDGGIDARANINVHIALRRFLHNHGNITTGGSPKPGLCPTLISDEFNGSL